MSARSSPAPDFGGIRPGKPAPSRPACTTRGWSRRPACRWTSTFKIMLRMSELADDEIIILHRNHKLIRAKRGLAISLSSSA
jgi:hypothetical protein